MKIDDDIIQRNNVKYHNPEIENSIKHHNEENMNLAEQKEKELLEKYTLFSDIVINLCLILQRKKNKQK